MVNLISQNVINNIQAVLQTEDDLPDFAAAPEYNTKNTNPVILHLADQVNKLAQQVVLLLDEWEASPFSTLVFIVIMWVSIIN